MQVTIQKYGHNPIGNLVQDVNEGIDQILWTVTGKVSDVIFSSSKDDLTFRYDPMGNRIAKIQKPKNWVDEEEWTVTWYSRDAQGNVLAVYTKPENSTAFSATEFNIYGSSRIGMVTQPEALTENPSVPVAFSQTLGNKVYEFSNHLGNVLTIFSDRKIPTEGDPGFVAYYTSEILSSTDYYPFGFQMPGRVYEGDYRFGFNGKEQDPETYGTGNVYDYGFRIYNPRIGKFLSVDPLTGVYPWLTPFQFATNCPISGIDIDGLEYFYSADGTLLGKYGISTEVFLVNEDYVKSAINLLNALKNTEYNKKYGSIALDMLDRNSCNTGLTFEELNTRAFLTTIRITEGHGTALAYNTQFGGGTFEGDQHPCKTIKAWRDLSSTAAGAYQFLCKTWNGIKAKLGLENFNGESQDKGALQLIKEKKALDDVSAGNIESAFKKLNKTWTSLPGGGEQFKNSAECAKIFKDCVAKELAGASILATPTNRVKEYYEKQKKNNAKNKSDGNNKKDEKNKN